MHCALLTVASGEPAVCLQPTTSPRNTNDQENQIQVYSKKVKRYEMDKKFEDKEILYKEREKEKKNNDPSKIIKNIWTNPKSVDDDDGDELGDLDL